MKINDRYASAVSSSNLKSKPETTYSDPDVLSAFAIADRRLSSGQDRYSKHPLAVPLQRLFTGDNTASVEIVCILANLIQGQTRELRLSMTRSQRIDMARAVVGWFRHPSCLECGGHGFKPIPDAPALSTQRCHPCDATGRVLLENHYRAKYRELVRWLVAKMEEEANMAGPAAMKALAPMLSLG